MNDTLFGVIPTYFSVVYLAIKVSGHSTSKTAEVAVFLPLLAGWRGADGVPFLLARSGRAPRPAKGEKGSLGFFYLEASCGVMDRCFNMGRYGRE